MSTKSAQPPDRPSTIPPAPDPQPAAADIVGDPRPPGAANVPPVGGQPAAGASIPTPEHENECLDESLEETFPASDPISPASSAGRR